MRLFRDPDERTYCALTYFILVRLLVTGAQEVEQTAATSVLLHPGAGTVTQSNAALSTQDPVNLTFIYPMAGVHAELPWIMLMTGANCFAQDYSVLEHQLASRGYLVAVADQLHPVAPPFTNILSPDREPQCSNSSWAAPTAAIFEDIHALLAQWTGTGQSSSASRLTSPTLPAAASAAIRDLNPDSVVIIGHSIGGEVALDMVAGLCEDPQEVLCSKYTAIQDVQGDDIIKGLVLWESPGSVFFANATLDIPDGIFVTYLTSPNGSFEARTESALDRTVGSCISYVQLDSGGNHYAITDWNPRSAPHQRAPCGQDNGAKGTFTSEEEHQELLLFMAELADANIRAQLLNDTVAADLLANDLVHSPLVNFSDFALHCFDT